MKKNNFSAADCLISAEIMKLAISEGMAQEGKFAIFRAGDLFEIYGNAATDFAELAKITVSHITRGGWACNYCGFPASSLAYYAQIITGAGLRFSVIDTPYFVDYKNIFKIL